MCVQKIFSVRLQQHEAISFSNLWGGLSKNTSSQQKMQHAIKIFMSCWEIVLLLFLSSSLSLPLQRLTHTQLHCHKERRQQPDSWDVNYTPPALLAVLWHHFFIVYPHINEGNLRKSTQTKEKRQHSALISSWKQRRNFFFSPSSGGNGTRISNRILFLTPVRSHNDDMAEQMTRNNTCRVCATGHVRGKKTFVFKTWMWRIQI